MPGRDRTGPLGQGPMTGWARGLCKETDIPGSAGDNMIGGWGKRSAQGQGGGCGRPRGRGGHRHRNMSFASGQPGWMRGRSADVTPPIPMPRPESQMLQERIAQLQSQLDQAHERLAALKAESKTQ